MYVHRHTQRVHTDIKRPCYSNSTNKLVMWEFSRLCLDSVQGWTNSCKAPRATRGLKYKLPHTPSPADAAV